MEEPKIIKMFSTEVCPHCGKSFVISTQTMPSSIVAIMKKDDMQKAKNTLSQRLDEITFYSTREKEEILSWLESEETMIDGSDIEPLIKEIQMSQLSKIQESKKK